MKKASLHRQETQSTHFAKPEYQWKTKIMCPDEEIRWAYNIKSYTIKPIQTENHPYKVVSYTSSHQSQYNPEPEWKKVLVQETRVRILVASKMIMKNPFDVNWETEFENGR